MQKSRSFAFKRNLLKILTYTVVFVFFFALGYGVFYLNKIQQFISSSNQAPLVTPSIETLPNQSNILLLGSDNDQKFSGNPLTQTMMIVHIDYVKKEVDLFSLPRDLWVKMPIKTETYAKIDQASEYNGIPSAIEVVENNFGIPIDHYAWVGLYGFIKSIDSMGGVNIDILHPVLDNSYPTDINSPNPYGYQRLDLEPGMQHLSGQVALEYVRSRHEDLLGDFGRTQRQRQLLNSLKESLLNSPNSILALPQVFDSLKGQVKSNITPSFGLSLGYFYLTNKATLKIKEYTFLPPSYSQSGYSLDGQSIVIANPQTAADLIGSIFGKYAANKTKDSLSNPKGIKQ